MRVEAYVIDVDGSEYGLSIDTDTIGVDNFDLAIDHLCVAIKDQVKLLREA